MAEILGITASIVSILQLTGTVIKYLNDFSNASKDCSRIILEISMVNGYLFGLQSILEKPKSKNSWVATSWPLSVPNGPIDQLQGVMERLSKRLEPVSGMKMATKAIFWPLRKEDVKDLLDTIKRYKTLFILALQNDHIGLSQAIRENMDQIQGTLQEAVNVISDIERKQADHIRISEATGKDIEGVDGKVDEVPDGISYIQQRQETHEVHRQSEENQGILSWLSPLNFWTRQKDIFSRRQEGTGK
ncbi:hypothetical protein MMC30_007076 [Trapelia coarctata]|nr:hypothetical protein [Trapelia coarctata]